LKCFAYLLGVSMNYPGKFPLIPGTVSMDNPLQKSNIIPVVSFLIKN
jgi:hypothetical protein